MNDLRIKIAYLFVEFKSFKFPGEREKKAAYVLFEVQTTEWLILSRYNCEDVWDKVDPILPAKSILLRKVSLQVKCPSKT